MYIIFQHYIFRSGSFTYGFKSPEFPVGTSLNVMITHVTSPQYFHCQGTRYAPAFGQLADKIHMHYSQLQPEEEILMLVSPGQPCIAQYSMDKSWYRAKVNRKLLSVNLRSYCHHADTIPQLSSSWAPLWLCEENVDSSYPHHSCICMLCELPFNC